MKETKQEIITKIHLLQNELNEYRDKLSLLENEELDDWFKKHKGNAYYYKYDKNDPEYSGIFRIEEIDGESNGFDWLYFNGTMINIWDKKTKSISFSRQNYNFIDFDAKIPKSKFNKIVRDFTSKLEKSL